MGKKKLLFVLGAYNYGGTVFSTLNMLSYLKDMYDVYVMALAPYGPVKQLYSQYQSVESSVILQAFANMPNDARNGRIAKVEILLYKLIKHFFLLLHYDITDFIYIREARKLNKKHQFDVVASTQEGISTRFVSLFENSIKIAWFRSEYSIYRHQLTEFQLAEEQRIYSKYDKIVCVSNTTKEDFCKYFDSIKDRVLAIHNIQNIDDIKGKSQQTIEDPFDQDTFNIVSVGRMAKQKQFYLIPKIAYEIQKTYGLKFKWYIIGDGNVSGELERFEDAMKKYCNSDVVIRLGSKINPYPYIALADLLVNTSYYEACPRVVAEAQILHTPVVCADFSSANEFVRNGYNGYVVNKDDLASQIAELIADKSKYSVIKSNSLKYNGQNEYILEQLKMLFK